GDDGVALLQRQAGFEESAVPLILANRIEPALESPNSCGIAIEKIAIEIFDLAIFVARPQNRCEAAGEEGVVRPQTDKHAEIYRCVDQFDVQPMKHAARQVSVDVSGVELQGFVEVGEGFALAAESQPGISAGDVGGNEPWAEQ